MESSSSNLWPAVRPSEHGTDQSKLPYARLLHRQASLGLWVPTPEGSLYRHIHRHRLGRVSAKQEVHVRWMHVPWPACGQALVVHADQHRFVFGRSRIWRRHQRCRTRLGIPSAAEGSRPRRPAARMDGFISSNLHIKKWSGQDSPP